jgi:hypothetical protein
VALLLALTAAAAVLPDSDIVHALLQGAS